MRFVRRHEVRDMGFVWQQEEWQRDGEVEGEKNREEGTHAERVEELKKGAQASHVKQNWKIEPPS